MAIRSGFVTMSFTESGIYLKSLPRTRGAFIKHHRVRKGSVDVLAKPVEDGTAICFFNKTALKQKVTFNLESLVGDNYVNAKFGDEITLKNIVGEATIKGKKVSATVPKDGVVAFIVK